MKHNYPAILAVLCSLSTLLAPPAWAEGKEAEPQPNTAIVPVPKLENDCYDWYARHAAVLRAKDKINPEIVLIGDSITHFWGGEPKDNHTNGPKAWASVFAPYRVLNLGFGWDRTQNVLWRLDHGELDGLHPRVVVIHIGSNNTSQTEHARQNTAAEIVEGIAAICDRVHSKAPGARIILVQVMPREEKPDHPRRGQITAINRLLVNFAQANHLDLLDLAPKLLKPDGTLPKSLMPDFCHPNEEGYTIWADALRPLLGPGKKDVGEAQERDRWLGDRLLGEAGPSTAASENRVFSLVYGEQPSDKLLAAWPRTSQSNSLSKDRTQYILTWTDATTGLQIRCVAVKYAEFPVVEWTVYCKNIGTHNTPMLANLQALDTRIERGPGEEYLLKYNKGDTCGPDLYQPLEKVLAPMARLRLAPAGGRGTNQAFPYYNLSMPGGGLILAVGWPGQWATTFSRDAARGLRIVAGQEVTHLVLRPGEEVRTPLVVLLFWKGADAQRAQNLWRRWMIAHNLPRTADDKLPPPIMPGNTSGEFNEMCNATEKDENQFIDRYVEERILIDYWWMDAGWYPCHGWPQTGTWEPDLKRFPAGLRAISDHARVKGIKTLVWFEPERVAGGTWLAQNHPEWLLGGTLLNLGNVEARTWLTDHTDKVLREQGIDLYRQDFNMDPLDFWRRNDTADRQGITENLHVQGYLAYWDALRARHPNLRIDSCASGGRRNDLETLRRAVPLHPTDYNYGHLAAKQAFHQSLFQWIPYFGSNTVPCDSVNAYGIRSGHAMSMVLGYDMRRNDLDYALLRKLTQEARLVAPYYYGDYYPLTPYTLAEDAWLAWQFNQVETEDGLVEAFRRPRSQKESIFLKLRGLDARAVYEIKNADLESPTRATGRELMEEGLPVVAARPPQAVLITYKRVRGTGYEALPDHQMAARPPSPQSSRKVTARAPL